MNNFNKIYNPHLDKLITLCYNYREFGCSPDIPKEITNLLEDMLAIAYDEGLNEGYENGYNVGYNEGYGECFSNN